MKTRTRNKIAMYETVLAVILENQSSWSGFPAFSSLVGDFSARLQELEALSLEQGNIAKGVTKAKNALRRETTTKARVLVGALKAYAYAVNDPQLKVQTDLSQSDLKRFSKLEFKHQLDAIIDLCSTHLPDLGDFGVDQSKIDELQALRDACETAFSTPRQAIISRKTITESIRLRINSMDTLLKKGIDALMISFKESVPDFYFHYKAARIIVDVPGKKNSTGSDPSSGIG